MEESSMNIKSTLSLRALAAAGLISASAACAAQVWCALPQGDASRDAVPLKDIARLQLSDDGVTFSIVRTDGKSAASGLTKITFAKCEEGATALRASAADCGLLAARYYLYQPLCRLLILWLHGFHLLSM